MKKKKVKQEYLASNKKKAISIENPDSFYDQQPVWSFSLCDFEHERWSAAMYPDILPGLLKRLKSLEQMKSWEAVLVDKAGRKYNPKNHYILVEDIISPAQKRLEELKLNDYDTLYSLTITGERRLWGIITEGTFFILWLDPHHEICPSHKKHT